MSGPLMIRVGIPASFTRFAAAAQDLGVGGLVSANAFFRHRQQRFRRPAPDLFGGLDVALDSAGFVAMVKYGDYPWSVSQYVELAKSHPWTWWASMDFCCEPEIAPNRAEVLSRVRRTVDMLAEVKAEAAFQRATAPMPVLQGWNPDDYLRCAEMMGDLPNLVGLGSVCRRHEDGPTGVITVIRELHAALPPNVRVHLFGVKGPAAARLRGHPRVASVDSAAWDREAAGEATKLRRAAKRAGGEFRCNVDYRISHMRRWVSSLEDAVSDRPDIFAKAA